jgi:hypothetical protein
VPESRALITVDARGEGESSLWTDLGFYVTQCLPWLPKGTPEQHFAVLGLRQQLSRVEWDAFVAAEVAEASAQRERRQQRRRTSKHSVVDGEEEGGHDRHQGVKSKRSHAKRHRKRRREEEQGGSKGREKSPRDLRHRRKERRAREHSDV